MSKPLRLRHCIPRLLVLLLALSSQARAGDTPVFHVTCNEKGSVNLWRVPAIPKAGKPLRLLVADVDEPLQTLILSDASGSARMLSAIRLGGPPWGLSAVIPSLSAGRYEIHASNAAGIRRCKATLDVGDDRSSSRPETVPSNPVWDLQHEAFFALWIEQLFDAPPEQSLSFPSLEPVLRDAGRNFLYDSLATGEDRQIPATPDCADLPYYLRAYFAWKTGLPFSYRRCNRGTSRSAPSCEGATVSRQFWGRKASAGDFKSLLRPLLDTVHSGSARTALQAEATDFYPIPLKREFLWPGTVYADPYGHVLMIAKWIAQTAEHPGILYAVDAQPDNSVARKRYWQGNFLHAHDMPGAGPGFKAFRPLTPSLKPMSNAELALGSDHAPYSIEQAELDTPAFHARMQQLIDPQGLTPDDARTTLLSALMEQLQTRVGSVDNGTRYIRVHPHDIIPMPNGSALFETIGAWEDYSTPSRDLRLMIALRVFQDLPEQVVLHPELFVLNGANPELIREEQEQAIARDLRKNTLTYIRSDGSQWPLRLADIYARKPKLEMAYNPNDCPEIRWGAEKGSEEYQTCTRQAPAEQKARMEAYRSGFREGVRPAR